MWNRTTRKRGFTLVELVVVIVILGLLAAIAIPRLSRGTAGAASSALAMDLAIVRNAISVYGAEHIGKFPGDGGANTPDQLTKYTDVSGNVSPTNTKDATYRFGPYLAAIPVCPVGGKASPDLIAIDLLNNPPTPTAGAEGWIYNPKVGVFIANTTDKDDTGKAYNTY